MTTWSHFSLSVCPRRAADFSVAAATAYSTSLRLVPSDQPRNCFRHWGSGGRRRRSGVGEPFCWVASIKAWPFSFRSGPARAALLHRQPLCRGPPGRILLSLLANRWAYLGCYYGFEKRANEVDIPQNQQIRIREPGRAPLGAKTAQAAANKDVRVCERRVRVRQPSQG